MKIGIIGAGHIANKMALTLSKMDKEQAYAIAARDYERARAFAQKWNMEKAYGSYEELADDPQVDLIYIATPHALHYEQARMCLMKKKNVLCEKTFTANAQQAAELCQLAHENNCYLAEAIWTRYMPFSHTIAELAHSGIIGTPYMLTASLAYPIEEKERIRQPQLCGGALFDLGVYPINFARMVFGTDIQRITSACIKGETGVDLQNNILFCYADGKMAAMQTSVRCANDRQGIISGTEGYIVVDNINNPQEAVVYDPNHTEKARYNCPQQITGFEYQIMAAEEAISKGWTESPFMPHHETIQIMEILDTLLKEWNITLG